MASRTSGFQRLRPFVLLAPLHLRTALEQIGRAGTVPLAASTRGVHACVEGEGGVEPMANEGCDRWAVWRGRSGVNSGSGRS